MTIYQRSELQHLHASADEFVCVRARQGLYVCARVSVSVCARASVSVFVCTNFSVLMRVEGIPA